MSKKLNRILALALVAVLLSVSPVFYFGDLFTLKASAVTSGKCGDNIT